MRALLWVLLTPCVLATLVGLVVLFPTSSPATDAEASGPRFDGHVSAAAERACDEDAGPDAGPPGCLALAVQLAEGPLAGRTIDVLVSAPGGRAPFGAGDDVVLHRGRRRPGRPGSYEVVDFQRGAAAAGAGAAVRGGGGGAGAVARAGRAGRARPTVAVLVAFVLPAILAGRDPLAVAVVGCCAIMFGVLYLTHGFSARTSTAVLGTLAGAGADRGAGHRCSPQLAHLTGARRGHREPGRHPGHRASTAAALVLAGLVIGALGRARRRHGHPDHRRVGAARGRPPTAPRELFARGHAHRPRPPRLGGEHAGAGLRGRGAAAAAAVLAWPSGAWATPSPPQVIATEVVRTLVGSIGLVVSVPLTTALAVAVATRGSLHAPD